MMLSSSGPANIAGNKVSTSIFTSPCSSSPSFSFSSSHKIFEDENENEDEDDSSLLFHDFQRATDALFCAASQQQGSDRVDRHSLAPDHFADVRWVQTQFVDCRPFPFHRRNRHGIGMLHQPFNDVFE